MTGVDPVLPGSGSFQATFSDSLQWTGNSPAETMPLLWGPRQFGQSSARRPAAVRSKIPPSAQAERDMAYYCAQTVVLHAIRVRHAPFHCTRSTLGHAAT